MMPTLTITPLPRPDAAVARPPEPEPASGVAAEAPKAGPGGFARVLRETEAPETSAEPTPETMAARRMHRADPRERAGPGHARPGDASTAAAASRTDAARTTAEADPTSTAEARAADGRHQSSEDRAIAEDASTASSMAEPATPALGVMTLALPALPPARIALDRHTPDRGGDSGEPPPDLTLRGGTDRAHAGGRGLAGRHPLAMVDGTPAATSGPASPARPGETRSRVDERTTDPTSFASSAPAMAIAVEPRPHTITAGPPIDAGSIGALPSGSATPAPDRPLGAGGADAGRPIAEARLTADPGSPAFTRTLGEHLGVWVRDGVQEARLHLHPADLGPVQIQIALEGQTAQVDFHAAHARTREAIEASLPALASALRESGFTLAGGGVFGQGAGGLPGRTPPRGGPAHARGPLGIDSGDDAPASVAMPHNRGWRRGLLDVFA